MTQGEFKKAGRAAAREWCKTTSTIEMVRLAADEFEYGDTLRDMQKFGHKVPDSRDRDFSWGFFKHVKGRVYSAIWTRKRSAKYAS